MVNCFFFSSHLSFLWVGLKKFVSRDYTCGVVFLFSSRLEGFGIQRIPGLRLVVVVVVVVRGPRLFCIFLGPRQLF